MDKNKYNRRSIRLKNYDYSQPGGYFITIVTHNRQCLFGNIVDGEMRLNEYGELVKTEWQKTGIIRPNIVIDAFVVMPNHLHGILIITGNDDGRGSRGGGRRRGTLQRASMTTTITKTNTDTNTGKIEQFGKPTKNSIPTIVRLFKSTTTIQINQLCGDMETRCNVSSCVSTPMQPLWQRNYYEHIIRDDTELTRIRQYIINNPKRWEEDNLNKLP